MGRHQSYTWIKNWSEVVSKSTQETLEDEALASKAANNILEYTLGKVNRRGNYNHWSGNLARSYIVQISSKKAYYLFKTKAGAGTIKEPIVYRPSGTNIIFFRLTKKWHGVNITRKKGKRGVFRFRDSGNDKARKKDEYWRRLRPVEGLTPLVASRPHWYLPKTKLRTSQKSKGISIVVGNETPYRKFVEKKYDVLSLKERERYKQIASNVYGKEINAVVKRICYNINRDLKTGRFTK